MPTGTNLDTGFATPPIRGRRPDPRSIRNRAAIIKATRASMAAGDFRPSARSIGKACGLSTRSVFQHFGTVDKLWRLALEDAGTRLSIVSLIVRTQDLMAADRDRIVEAAVWGRG